MFERVAKLVKTDRVRSWRLDSTGPVDLLDRVRLCVLPGDALLLQAQGDHQLSLREGTDLAPLSRRACAAALSEWGGALHRLQAVRGDLPGTGHHHRGGGAAQRRHAADHPLRRRYDEMHLLRLLSGGLPCRCHRPGTKRRVRDRDTRGALLRQGTPAHERRPLGASDREEHLPRCALSMSRLAIAAVKRGPQQLELGHLMSA